MGRVAAVVVAALLLFATLSAPGATTQNPPQAIPRFRTGVELVLLDVSVLDADRRPVRGLTAGDFIVVEDGRPQNIASFSAVDLPDVIEETVSAAAWVRTVASDVRRNTDLKDRRIVVIVMDDATPMPAVEVPRAKTLARRAIEALGPGDLACVAFTLDKKSGQEFTQDRARLLAAVERFNGAIDNQPGLSRSGMPDTIPFDAFNAGAATLYHATLDTLRGMADSLAELPERRKALMFVSVGIPFEMGVTEVVEGGGTGATGVLRQLAVDLQDSLAAAQRANVAIYGLDPGGLRAPGDQAVRSAEPNHPGRLNADFLKTVSENTGGFTVVDTNAPEQQIQQILRENASYYLLGYAPSNGRAEGRFRRLEVKVKRPGVTVRARNGYFEPRPATAKKASAPAPGAASVLGGILPKTDLPITLAAAPFAVPGQRDAALAVVLSIQRPAPARAMRIDDSMDVRVAAYAPGGQHRASTHQIIPVGVSTSGLGGTIGYELLLRLDVPPGRYQLRVAAQRSPQGAGATDDDTSGKSGGVYADLDVPDFSKEALSLSGLALSVSPSVVSGPKGALASVMPIVPTTMREFRTGDRVTAFLQAYQGGARPVVAATVTVRMVDAQGASVFETTEAVGPERFGAARAADLRFDVPTAQLRRGPYLLTVEANISKASARRKVRFAVR
jgi:VWFA-related protein